MSEEHDKIDQSKPNLRAIDPIGARFDQLEKLFAQFLIQSQEDRSKGSEDNDRIRLIQLTHMVSFNLRESVIGSYNTFLYEDEPLLGIHISDFRVAQLNPISR